MLASTLLAALLPALAIASPALEARGSRDKFGGKTLAPSNYTVVPGFFIQDEPTFNSTGYDVLKDSFGLMDKSKGRWKTFTKYVLLMDDNGMVADRP